jgi:hypothetical protein
VLGLGVLLVVIPNFVLTTFGLAPTKEVWIRVVGMLLLFLGTYDVLAGWTELREFIRWSVPIRMSIIVFFVAFVALGFERPALLPFAVVDLAFAIWTVAALRREKKEGRLP